MEGGPARVRQQRGVDLFNSTFGDDLLLILLLRLQKRADLNACSLVCKRWLRVLSTSAQAIKILRAPVIPAVLMRYQYLENLDCSLCNQVGDLEVQAIAMAYGARLRNLCLSNNKWISSVGVKAIGLHCWQLQQLALGFCSITDSALASVAQCTKLKILNLTSCRAITDEGLHHIAAGCTGLVDLCLRWTQGITDDGIVLLAAGCTALETLDLAYTKVTEVGLQAVAGLPSLRHLSLAACSMVDDLALIGMRGGCKTLQNLDLGGCEAITDVGLVTFLSAVSHLEQLSLNYCRQITDSMLVALPSLAHLRVLKLDLCSVTAGGLLRAQHVSKALQEVSLRRCGGVQDSGLEAFLGGCSALQRLDLTCCPEITDATMALIATHCKGLLSLKLEGCTKLTSQGLSLVGAACQQLQELDCTDCNINDSGVKAIAQCRELRDLKLGFGLEITDPGAADLGASCQSLTALDLYRCEKVGDRGLASVLRGCPSITEINLSYTAVTDEGMPAFSFCPDLINGEFRGNPKLTSKGLAHLARECPSLTDIDLKHCRAIGDEGLLAIAEHCPGLRQINLSYSPITHVSLAAVSKLACMGNIKLVHCKNLEPSLMAGALLDCGGLKKLKLLSCLRPQLPVQTLDELEKRGCKIRWMDKPDPEASP